MKHIKIYLIIIMLVGTGYVYECDHADMNMDGSQNVLDIVIFSGCILNSECSDDDPDTLCGCWDD